MVTDSTIQLTEIDPCIVFQLDVWGTLYALSKYLWAVTSRVDVSFQPPNSRLNRGLIESASTKIDTQSHKSLLTLLFFWHAKMPRKKS